MKYDAKVPHVLKREQQWFGSIIGRPIDEDSKMNPISPSGDPMEVEAAEHIAPSPTLRPAQRMQIYNQQYWWRLLNTLHETFPLLTRLFGYYDFNRTIGIPYLVKFPPRHWSLSVIGDRMAQWIDEEYHAADRELVHNAALVDWAFTDSFLQSQVPPLNLQHLANPADAEAILEKTLYSQPHLRVFEFEYELFRYRVDFLKFDPDYWLNNDFPELDRSKPYYFVLYRNLKNDISWKDISAAEYHILKQFQTGTSIDELCQWLEGQEEIGGEAIVKLQTWFQEWTHRGWLSLQDPRQVPPQECSSENLQVAETPSPYTAHS